METELVNKLKRGDRKVVEELYQNAFSYCSKVILQNNGSMDDAKDLFQEALIVLFKNVRKDDFQLNCNVKTYLYSVMRNLWLKRIHVNKTSGKTVELKDEHQDFLVIDNEDFQFKSIQEERYQLVNEAFQTIKDDCRSLLMNYYFKKIALKEIAVMMEYTYQFAKVKKNRCMTHLKTEVAKLQQS